MMNKEFHIFKKNAIFSAISLGSKLFANIFIFLIIANTDFVSTSEFGFLTYAIGLGITFTLLADYGIETYAVRDIAKGIIDQKNFNSIFTFRLLLSILSFLLLIAYLYIFKIENKLFVIIIALSAFLNFLARTVQLFFQAIEKFHYESIGTTINNTLLILLVIVNSYFFKDFMVYAYIFLFSRLMGFIVSTILFRRLFKTNIGIRINLSEIKTIFVASFSFALLTIMPTLMINLDTVLIKEFINNTITFVNTQIAFYSATIKIMILFTFIASVFQKSLTPQLSRLSNDKNILKSSISLLHNTIINFNTISAIFIFYCANDIIALLYNKQYAEAADFLKLVAVVIILRTSVAYGLYFTIIDKLKVRVISSSILLSSFLIFSFIFIRKYNGIGALYAIIAAYILTWIYTLWQTKKYFGSFFLNMNKTFFLLNTVLYLSFLYSFNPNFILAIIATSCYMLFYLFLIKKQIFFIIDRIMHRKYIFTSYL